MTADIEFTAFFDATPSPYLVLDTDLVIRYVNPAYGRVTGRTADELVGKRFFDALPENPGAEQAEDNLRDSLNRVLNSGKPETLVLQRYDIPARDGSGGFEERWWSEIHTPIAGPDGAVRWIVQRADDVTGFVRSQRTQEPAGEFTDLEKGMAAELYVRAREVHRLNQELRQAHARERQIGVALQEAMLSAPTSIGTTTTSPCAICPRPPRSTCAATGTTSSTCRPTATPPRSATWSGTGCTPPLSWACSAAP